MSHSVIDYCSSCIYYKVSLFLDKYTYYFCYHKDHRFSIVELLDLKNNLHKWRNKYSNKNIFVFNKRCDCQNKKEK